MFFDNGNELYVNAKNIRNNTKCKARMCVFQNKALLNSD